MPNFFRQVREKLKVSNVIFNFNDTVKCIDGDIATMIPTYKNAMKEISENLISPFVSPKKNHIETQTAENKVREPNYSILREERVRPTNPIFK